MTAPPRRRRLRTAVLVALSAGALAGCADQPPLIDRLSRGNVVGDADRVSIAGGRLDALPLAVAHCARFGRSAQWSHSDGDRSVYACVARP